MKNFINEFKAFALKGNVMDLAVGMMIGAAFGKIVSSLVNDILMPLIAAIFRISDFTGLKVLLIDKGDVEANVYLNYGQFIQNIV
ncbi:MAG TPA: large conductance mechanosensitive channel protein MscL, partial [Erysipelotrichaceae bacterium]|nr:large conductance mechanosensitive channel protein MscL [Erysipelotrichaceae bacterium]